MRFRIDFLNPGRAFPKDTPFSKIQAQFASFFSHTGKKLAIDVGASFSALVIGVSVLIVGFFVFQTMVYKPREKQLQDASQQIKSLEEQARIIREKQQQEESKHKLIKDRIDRLMGIKRETITWCDKLKAINRNLVSGVWLSSLEVTDRQLKIEPPGSKPNQPASDKPAEAPKVIASQMIVVMKGGTRDQKEAKPLKLISRFMGNMMQDPIWGKHFDFKDWKLSSLSKVITVGGHDPDKPDQTPVMQQENEIAFELQMERKQ